MSKFPAQVSCSSGKFPVSCAVISYRDLGNLEVECRMDKGFPKFPRLESFPWQETCEVSISSFLGRGHAL